MSSVMMTLSYAKAPAKDAWPRVNALHERARRLGIDAAHAAWDINMTEGGDSAQSLSYANAIASAAYHVAYSLAMHMPDARDDARVADACERIVGDAIGGPPECETPEPCLHPGVFAGRDAMTSLLPDKTQSGTEHCHACGRDVPHSEL